MFVVSEIVEDCSSSRDPLLDIDSLDTSSGVKSDEYIELQFRVLRLTLLLTIFSVGIAGFFFGIQATASLLIGALSGIFYFRLLARGVGRLGTSSKIVGKVQLLVPVLLVLASSRFPQLDLIPALLGFLLYKPALIIQFLSMP
jgi:ATP synthase protein I